MQLKQLERYLELLDVPRRKPGLDALQELVQAHLCRIPFENISKLYYQSQLGLQGLPGFDLYLDGVEQFNFGGTCYSNNNFFYQLLANLGYQAILCGADMSNPDVHLVSLVELEGRQYLVDVGYAAPFTAPLPRDLAADHVVILGRDRYLLRSQDTAGCSRLEMYRDGKLKHGYVVKPAPRVIGDFEQVIAASYRSEASFMNSVLLARFCPRHALVLSNLTLSESRGGHSSMRQLTDRDELPAVIAECFGIPVKFSQEAVSRVGQFEDVWD